MPEIMQFMEIYVALAALVATVVSLLAYIIISSRKPKEDLSAVIEHKLNELFPNLLHTAGEQVVALANEKLKAETQDIKTDLSNKKTMIEDLVNKIKTEVEANNKRIEDAERERIGSFSALKKELETHRTITEQLSATTEGLKKVLSNNQLRGQFGEQVAEDLLKMAGFVRGIDYLCNTTQESVSTRPDFTILLPDKVKINVDSKFPYANLQKLVESQDAASRQQYTKEFEKDIKDKIKQVTTRDYINPDDNTVDFVILFIPNEMIFSYIYDKMNDIWTEAMKQKVVFAGPFSFTAILRLVRQSYANFKYQNNVHQIITYIKAFEKEFESYNTEFQKIGIKLKAASEQYESVDTTRKNKLLKTIDKINLQDSVPAIMASPDVALLPAESIVE